MDGWCSILWTFTAGFPYDLTMEEDRSLPIILERKAKEKGLRAKIVGVTLVAIVFVAIFFTLPILQSTPIDGSAHPVTVRTSLSCPLTGFGEVYVSWIGWVGYEWSWKCHNPSDVTIPNIDHWNATSFSSS